MLGILFTLPDATTTLNGIGAYSTPIFSDFMPFIELVLGIIFAFFAVLWIIRIFMHRN